MTESEVLKGKSVGPDVLKEKQYYLASDKGIACERLPLDSRFAKRMMRGAEGKANMYVTAEQTSQLRQYVPKVKWSKDERIVFSLMQDVIDRTGEIPTVAQIAEVSKGRAKRQSKKNMEKTELFQDGTQGLSSKQVQRAMVKLQKRGVVSQLT